ncbi:MAG TPA: copper homeostasis protein CutC [Armatimonadota bacterium]|nr:copper homeostasis protein CutC [Armatimonadota bacterium]
MLLETIVSSLDDARAAAAGGADRFELCGALAVGGLTPSLGTLQAIKEAVNVPVMCMVRPREGGMAYTDAEIAVMERDAALALEAGADGLVFGFLTEESGVDVHQCRRFLHHCSRIAAGRQWVFHRAFDVVADPRRSLEELINLGFTRVLTSGRAAGAMEGLDEIRRTVEQADGRIEVLPGGGIRVESIPEVVRRTGADQVHLFIAGPRRDPSASANPAIHFGVPPPATETEYHAVDGDRVRRARQLLDSL